MLMLAALGAQACIQAPDMQPDTTTASPTPGEIPTWTPRPKDLTALPTATKPAPVSGAQTATPAPTRTPKKVAFALAGGNLNIRRGPSLAYNYVDVLYDGNTVIVIGRDRIGRWLMIELPSRPGLYGWVTTETAYSTVKGDVSSLPFVKAEPAAPAYIRNCTKHTLWILPAEVNLLDKFNEPFNEERFNVGVYQVYDLENPDVGSIQEVTLSEGKTVDITKDWAGEKSKCE